MSNKGTPRFTRRVYKDVSGIKVKSQKMRNLAITDTKDKLRWANKIKKHIILTDLNLFLC